MKITKLILPSVVIGTAFVLTTPRESQGFSTLGHDLVPNQSDFRVFNNFLDAAANNNTADEANFPGYDGAVVAIWKGCVEWASENHGNGNGDPHQTGGLGSGNSNFDPMFTGEANGTGVIGTNIHSALDDDGGGTLAFMQGGGFGWWIRYYENHTWNDGPNANVPFSHADLQGVATHEYGHALGLGHTSSGGATMTPFGGGVSERSIENDDQNGVQFIYGHKSDSGTKPVILSVTNLGGQVRIVGQNFTTNNNQVWFTPENPGSVFNGDPVKVTGVSATNGDTEILINIPAAAGPGDVIVKRNSPTQSSTSNPWPFDPDSVTPPAPMITSVNPSTVPALTPTGGAQVTLMGSGLATTTDLVINGDVVGDPSDDFSGSFTVVDDNQVDVVMPLGSDGGTVDIELTAAGGIVLDQIDIVPPSSPVLTSKPLGTIVLTDGWEFAVSSNDLDIQLLYFSVVDGNTTIPGIWELEIGGGLFGQNVFFVKSFIMGPKFWRRFFVGPFGPNEAPSGTMLFFDALVANPGPQMDYMDFPWDSTNKLTLTVQ